MTSVNLRQQAPYTPGYEASSQPAPARDERGAEVPVQAETPANSAHPRAPMTPEQRGQLSTHRNIMNPPQSEDSSSLMAEFKRENQELHARVNKLSSDVAPKIQTLYRQIQDLTAQLSAKKQSTEKAAPAMDTATPQTRSADTSSVASSENSSPQDPVSTQPSQTTNLSQAAQEQAVFHQQIKGFFEKLTMALNTLQEQVKNLIAQISGKGTPKTEEVSGAKGTPNTEEASGGTGTDGAPASDEASSSPQTDESTANTKTLASDDTQSTASSTPAQTDESTKADDSATSSTPTLEQLKQNNMKMSKAIEEQEQILNDTISTLQKQVDDLTQQLSAQTK